jgi:hypothetical protein
VYVIFVLNTSLSYCIAVKWFEFLPPNRNHFTIFNSGGRDRVVGRATCYALDAPEIESRCQRDFPHPSRLTLGLTQLPVQRVSFPRVKRPGRGVNHPRPSSAEVKERVELYFYSPLWAFIACPRVNFTLNFNNFLPFYSNLSWILTHKLPRIKYFCGYPFYYSGKCNSKTWKQKAINIRRNKAYCKEITCISPDIRCSAGRKIFSLL